ncbi:hypothetical protein SAMN05444287_1824 [Octadecabacter temperatus]|uniref:Uncharacterized protein n=1 Tax=Octadecabacter temperatus TaxID=1458307 RepID=A0A0K0Y6W2_9RHOB|nr:hypothetical protein OSB_21650 [Octadecabacter temperatus]SIO19631.1 hypothetical protein SAMN05444287_1824 [Octadecabacter temperatus]
MSFDSYRRKPVARAFQYHARLILISIQALNLYPESQ